ncbi:MAG TPA: hypothetical protein VF847_01125 [Candidatus Deferrimicrobiaceae bacterium]
MSGAADNGRSIGRRYVLGIVLRLFVNFAVGVAILQVILFFVLSRPFAGEYAAVHHQLRGLAAYLGPVVTVAVLAYALLASLPTAALCVYILHRVAGPLYRVERVLEEFRSGAATRPVSFRNGDQAGALAEAFNAWIGVLRQDRGRLLARMEEAERLCLLDEATCRSEMERTLRQVADDLARYR